MRVLSASNTLSFKVVTSVVMIGLGLWGVLDKWHPAYLVSFVVPAWMAWTAARFKRVALDETSLRVSNFVHEIVVPLDQIDRVSERMRPLRAIVLELNERTRFGRRIEFSPPGSSHPPPPHPLLIELEYAIGAAKRAKQAR
jgi:hypothetical protein